MKSVFAAAPHATGNRKNGFIKEFGRSWPLFAMLTPGAIILIINNYIPMFGVIIAF